MRTIKKLAIIGASYLQLPLVEKAKEMGLETHCFAWEKGAVCKEIADFFYPVSIIEKEQILQKCEEIGINGICTIASDVAAPTVAYAAENMGLVGNSYESAVKANNKYLMRNAFISAGVPCPQYKMIKSVDEVRGFSGAFPLIVKPTDRSGSLGVSRVLNQQELESAVEKALDFSFKKEVMVEEFVEGREISVEFISYQGVHYPLQITDKVTTGAPHFVELEHHQPANLPEKMFSSIYDLTRKALDALGITNGASHSEYRITKDGRVVVMEIGARMGGDFIGSDLVQLSTGYDFLKGVIDVALGLFDAPKIKKHSYSGIYFLCKETESILSVIKNATDFPEIVRAEVTDSVLRSINCSADRSGYLIYKTNNKRFLI